MRRFFELSARDQHGVFADVVAYLAPNENEQQALLAVRQQLDARAIALDALADASRQLGLPVGQAPTAQQYERVAREHGLMSKTAVGRAWDTWRTACAAYRDEPIPETSAQRSLRRATSGRQRGHEEYLAGVRAWLAQQPPPASRTTKDYDAYVRARNEKTLRAARSARSLDAPLLVAATITTTLHIRWASVLDVARGTIDLVQAQAIELDHLRRIAGSLQLVGRGAVGLLWACGNAHAGQLTQDASFPPAVTTIGGRTAWWLPELVADRDGHPLPKRPSAVRAIAEQLPGHRLVGSTELARTLQLATGTIQGCVQRHEWQYVPQPAGKSGTTHYWLEADIARWRKERTARSGRHGSRSSR